MWYLLTLQCDSIFKSEGNPVIFSNMNEVGQFGKSEISQLQEDKSCMIPFT